MYVYMYMYMYMCIHLNAAFSSYYYFFPLCFPHPLRDSGNGILDFSEFLSLLYLQAAYPVTVLCPPFSDFMELHFIFQRIL